MSRQKNKKDEEKEAQVVAEVVQDAEDVQVEEEQAPVGPHPVSMLQVRGIIQIVAIGALFIRIASLGD